MVLNIPSCACLSASDLSSRIGEDEIGAQAGVLVVRVGVTELYVPVNAVNEQVHPAEAVSKVLTLLPVEREQPVVLREDVRLHEHSARTAARVVNHTFFRLKHGDQRPHNAHGREV